LVIEAIGRTVVGCFAYSDSHCSWSITKAAEALRGSRSERLVSLVSESGEMTPAHLVTVVGPELTYRVSVIRSIKPVTVAGQWANIRRQHRQC
jgi:hypothetical protein